MMDLNQLAVFVRVMECGSFTAAAKALHQPKSRVSRRIAALEKALGIALVYRTTRQFSPTEAGKHLYEKCRHQVDAIENALQALQESAEEVSGVLKLATTEDVGSQLLGPIITEMKQLYPRLTVELQLSGDIIDLVRDSVDLAIRIGSLDDTSLRTRMIGKLEMILVASPTYHTPIESLDQLSQHPCLVFAPELEDNKWSLTRDGKKFEEVQINPVCRANHPRILLDLAIAGQGIALLPEFLCTDALKQGRLQRILSPYATQGLPIQFVWPLQKEEIPKVKAFINLSIKYLTPYFSVLRK